MQTVDAFRFVTQKHVRALTNSVLLLGRRPSAVEQLDECVQAVRSIKTVAHSAGVKAIGDLAYAMEIWFVTARQCGALLRPEQIDLMLRCAEMLDSIAKLCRDVEHVVRIVEESPPGRQSGGASPIDELGVSGGTRRVLVVDDSAEMRELARDLLGYRGYSVEVAVDGIDGWNAIRTGHFDLVLTDIDMPLVDGIRLTELIKKEECFASLSILVVCDDCDTDRMRLLEAGADYYVIKSKLEDTLARTVARLIGPARS